MPHYHAKPGQHTLSTAKRPCTVRGRTVDGGSASGGAHLTLTYGPPCWSISGYRWAATSSKPASAWTRSLREFSRARRPQHSFSRTRSSSSCSMTRRGSDENVARPLRKHRATHSSAYLGGARYRQWASAQAGTRLRQPRRASPRHCPWGRRRLPLRLGPQALRSGQNSCAEI